MRVLNLLCALLLGLGALLRLGSDVLTTLLRLGDLTPPAEPDWLSQAVAGLFVTGATLGIPAQIRLTADNTDRARPWLFAGSGALFAALLILATLAAIGLHGGIPMLHVAGLGVSRGLGGHLGAMPILLLVVGLGATAFRASPAAGALLTLPLITLSALAMALDVSVTGAALTATLPMLLATAALVPAVLITRRWSLAIWPISTAAIALLASILLPGMVTPSELTALIAIPAIVVGALSYAGAPPERRAAWLERATSELGGLVLALAALNLMAFAITAVPEMIDVKRMLAGVSPSAMLGLTFLAYVLIASIVSPLVGVAVIFIMPAAAYGAGVAADTLVVGLTLAAVQTTITRGTSRQQTPDRDSVDLPHRQAYWAQTLIMILLTGLAVATVMGWI